MGNDRVSARVKAAYILAKQDIVAPQMSAEDWADLKRGVDLFNSHQFWHAHEAWEDVWRRHQEPSRIFFQGLIQAAAACYQTERGVFHGARKHYQNALFKLRQFPDVFLNVQVRELVTGLVACETHVNELGPDGLLGFEATLFPVIR